MPQDRFGLMGQRLWSYLGYKPNHYTFDNKAVDDAIISLKKALTDEVVVLGGIGEAVQNPYGLIFAFQTLHTESLVIKRGFQDTHPERSAQKASMLGRDIQIIFVEKENKAHLDSFLREHGLDRKITLVDMDCLPKAIRLNELASPYFAKISKLLL